MTRVRAAFDRGPGSHAGLSSSSLRQSLYTSSERVYQSITWSSFFFFLVYRTGLPTGDTSRPVQYPGNALRHKHRRLRVAFAGLGADAFPHGDGRTSLGKHPRFLREQFQAGKKKRQPKSFNALEGNNESRLWKTKNEKQKNKKKTSVSLRAWAYTPHLTVD